MAGVEQFWNVSNLSQLLNLNKLKTQILLNYIIVFAECSILKFMDIIHIAMQRINVKGIQDMYRVNFM